MSVGMVVLRSTDSGAPVLSGQNGALVAVLDWALAQKGWTTIATATNQRIYKTAAGNGYCLYVAHDSTISGGAQYATIRGCEATSTLASLVNPFPTLAQISNASQRCSCSIAASSAARAYTIYLTDRYVRMMVDNVGSNAQWTGWHFGDLYGAQAVDTYCTLITSWSSTSPTYVDIQNNIGGGSPMVAFARDITGTILSSIGQLAARSSQVLGANTRFPAARAGYMNRIVREKISYDCSGNAAIGFSAGPTAQGSRGWVANWWAPLHNGWGALSNGDTFADSAYNPSAVFRMYGYSTSQGWSIHEETDTWSPPSG